MALTMIEQYEVIYSANQFAPRIGLKNGNKYIGQLIFEADGSVLPDDSIQDGQVILYYYLENFENVIDILRNEKPVYLLFSGSGGGFENGIMTSAEQVGEEEKRSAFVLSPKL